MLEEVTFILSFIIESLFEIWPYLLVTIPLAVAVNMSGASKYIDRAFNASPVAAIFMATVVGAFSPFCSCTVIPIVASLLIGGVPLAPVMAFWIASPSMDPEIFFLSVATIGWELALWRVVATLILSLSAGLVTHHLQRYRLLGHTVLRQNSAPTAPGISVLLKKGWQMAKQYLVPLRQMVTLTPVSTQPIIVRAWSTAATAEATCSISGPAACDSGCQPVDEGDSCGSSCDIELSPTRPRLLDETWQATLLVIKFMLLAFFLEALIVRYVPTELIGNWLGSQNPYAILLAALIGVPVYTTNLAALPLIGGLLAQGMSPAAALAFLIAGPTTTLPAMAAVWGLTTRRVFALYVSFSLIGAVSLGYLYHLLSAV